MLSRTCCSIAAAVTLAVGFTSTEAPAYPPSRHRLQHPAWQTGKWHHGHLFRHPGPAGVYASPRFGRFGYAAPGYVFVPGRGILGEDCNMPTSTCPNEMRDVQ
jgi:hypothetical protein